MSLLKILLPDWENFTLNMTNLLIGKKIGPKLIFFLKNKIRIKYLKKDLTKEFKNL